jgi:hypothetical protein
MKQLKCPDCEKTFKGETAKDVMNAMHPHYMSDHEDIIKNANEEQKKEWMAKFNKDFEAAEEIENN